MTANKPALIHPYEFLPHDNTLAQDSIAKLEANATEIVRPTNDEPTIYKFDGVTFNFVDKEVWIYPQDMTYDIPKHKDCVCYEERAQVLCQCHMSSCPGCNQALVAANIICDFDTYCLDEGCPACKHYREDCGKILILQSIKTSAQDKAQHNNLADAYSSAIADVTGTDPARFSITDELLDSVATRTEVPRPYGQTSLPKWTFSDSSVITSSLNRLWYE